MKIRNLVYKVQYRMPALLFKLVHPKKTQFECPICGYIGPFMDVHPETGVRKHAKCPKCGALERHRLQYLAVKDVIRTLNVSELKMLHVAPEQFLKDIFVELFGEYKTADLNMKGVDYNVDLQALPFANESFDIVFASHVLEHIPDDEKAISEIRRILRKNGVAILPVPIVCHETIEYLEPNPSEAYHVRAPGIDYFKKYEKYFTRVDTITSGTLANKYQLFIYEDRTVWPTTACPLRMPMQGQKHVDYVPICHV